MQIEDKNPDDEFLKKVLQEYFPKPEETGADILTLHFIKKLEYDGRRCFSLHNEKIYKDWKKFLDRLPSSKDEIIPRVEEKFWRWKMYKKYIPEEKTNFRKTMKSGPDLDKFGRLPITGEDLSLYRSPCSYQKSKVKK